MGIEPTLSAWKAEVLPLNYTRSIHGVSQSKCKLDVRRSFTTSPSSSQKKFPGFDTERFPTTVRASNSPALALLCWRGEDSNLRRLSRQIYSLIPLTTREPLPITQKTALYRASAMPRQSILANRSIFFFYYLSNFLLTNPAEHLWCRHKESNPGPSHYK